MFSLIDSLLKAIKVDSPKSFFSDETLRLKNDVALFQAEMILTLM